MKARFLTTFILVIDLALFLTWTVGAQGLEPRVLETASLFSPAEDRVGAIPDDSTPASSNGAPGRDTSAVDVSELASSVPGWVQVNANGFGDPQNSSIMALEVFDDYLYASSFNANEGGRVWRTADTVSWEVVSDAGFGSVYTNTNAGIPDMVVFNDRLYAGTGWTGSRGQIWRSSGGTTWTPVVTDGFGDANNLSIGAFAVFSDTLYAATAGYPRGVQVWRSSSGDALSWTNVVTEGLGNTTNNYPTGMTEFDGYLYAAIENTTEGAEVWRTDDGLAWTAVVTGGFDSSDNISTGGFAAFGGYLYLGTSNAVTGAQLWRSSNGTIWEQVVSNGFGDNDNLKIESLVVFKEHLYATTHNSATGMEVWQSPDGITWERKVVDRGWGDSNNFTTLFSNGTTTFRNSLLIGTWNWSDGGEVWMSLHNKIYLPLVSRNY